jgi:hypothetical protein
MDYRFWWLIKPGFSFLNLVDPGKINFAARDLAEANINVSVEKTPASFKILAVKID